MSREEIIEKRAGENLDEFMEHGPGLRVSTRSWILATGDEGNVLTGGLGGLGIGTMWGYEADHHRNDPTYAEAPYNPSRRDDFGRTGYSREINDWVQAVEVEARNIANEAYKGMFAEACKVLAKDLLTPKRFTTAVTWGTTEDVVFPPADI